MSYEWILLLLWYCFAMYVFYETPWPKEIFDGTEIERD